MMLAVNQIKFKVLAVVVAVGLVMSMVMMPVGAAQAQERGKGTNKEIKPGEVIGAINSSGAEIEIMENGTPVMVVEVKKEDEEIYIPLTLPSTVEAKNITDGSKITVEVDGNYLLLPHGEEIERVCISEFEVKKVKGNGQVVLVGEVNPVWKAFLAKLFWTALSGAVGGATGAVVAEAVD